MLPVWHAYKRFARPKSGEIGVAGHVLLLHVLLLHDLTSSCWVRSAPDADAPCLSQRKVQGKCVMSVKFYVRALRNLGRKTARAASSPAKMSSALVSGTEAGRFLPGLSGCFLGLVVGLTV